MNPADKRRLSMRYEIAGKKAVRISGTVCVVCRMEKSGQRIWMSCVLPTEAITASWLILSGNIK
jgi:hypothetical protein